MNDKQLFWLAGLLEGEGCFSLGQSKYKKKDGRKVVVRFPTIRINMNDRDVLVRVSEIVGHGNVNGPYGAGRGGNPNASGYYQWAATGDKARELMNLVLPIMCERRAARIREVLGTVMRTTSD